MEHQEQLDELEALKLSLWDFTKCAGALEEARKMDRNRAAYFEELYEDVRIAGVRYADATEPVYQSASVESQALEIIDAKNAYDLRIIRLKEKYGRWRAFLRMVDKGTASFLVDHFERGQRVPPDRLRDALRKASRAWDSFEEARGHSLDQEAKEDYTELRKRYAEPRKPKRKLSLYEDGKWILIDPDEYERLQRRRKFAAQDEALRRYFRETLRHPDAL